MAVFHISDMSFLLFGMSDTSYKILGLLCEGLYSQNVDGGSTISSAILLVICAISNQPVAGSIIVRHHNLSGVYTFRGIVYGPTRSTHRVSQGFVSAFLGGSFPYF